MYVCVSTIKKWNWECIICGTHRQTSTYFIGLNLVFQFTMSWVFGTIMLLFDPIPARCAFGPFVVCSNLHSHYLRPMKLYWFRFEMHFHLQCREQTQPLNGIDWINCRRFMFISLILVRAKVKYLHVNMATLFHTHTHTPTQSFVYTIIFVRVCFHAGKC